MRAGFVLAEGFKKAPPKKEKHLAGPLPGGFYSDKQRRKVLGGIRAGTIRVPYLRTGNLQRSWSVSRPKRIGGALTVTVSSDPAEAPYNVLVQDEATRPEMHDDWPSVETVTREYGNRAAEMIVAVLRQYGFK